MSNRMTPKDFALPLLAVMAELTEFEPNVALPMGETYKPVCERMGIEEDHGGETSHGSMFTHRNIGLAFRQHIRGKGLGAQGTSKGYWMLTQEGIDKARQEFGTPTPEAPEAPETPAVEEESENETLVAARTDATAEVIVAPEPEATEEEGAEIVHLPVAPQTHPYNDDPYIRSLAIEAVECYGAWVKRSDACKACPLATDCRIQVGARKAELAARLDAAEAEALKKLEDAQAEENKKSASVSDLINAMGDGSTPPRNGSKFKPSPGQDYAPANASRESLCLQCGETIEKDTPVMWCDIEGIFHVECFDDSELNASDD